MAKKSVDVSRRGLLRGRLSAPKAQMRLPWVLSEEVFTDQCSRCNDCHSACTENIIVKGDGGFPTIDFSQGECTFCSECVDVCKEPLFLADKTGAAWPTSLSFLDSCLAKNDVYCLSCQDVCDTQAISFVYAAGTIPQPQIVQDDCTACGACIVPCPTQAIELTLNN